MSQCLPYSVPTSLKTNDNKFWNINRISIDYAFQPRLRSRLTLGGLTWPRKPLAFGGWVSRPSYRYSCQHTHLSALHMSSRSYFNAHTTLLYHLWNSAEFHRSIASVTCLAPLNFRRRLTGLVSCYAFFKGWLLLSQPPNWLSPPTSFNTEHVFWDLSWWSGVFPFC